MIRVNATLKLATEADAEELWRMQGGKHITAEVTVENIASNALLRRLDSAAAKETEFKKCGMDVRYKSVIYEMAL